jgi:putative hemolysin
MPEPIMPVSKSRIEVRAAARAEAKPEARLERTLARLSADEIVAALRLARAPRAVRAGLRAAFDAVSRPLGRTLARFDGRVASLGPAAAAAAALADLGATWTRTGPALPSSGPVLVVANHPGAYDALVLLAASARDDVAVIAADRVFLRAMPSFRRHLVFVPEGPAAAAAARAHGLRRARAHLKSGGALVQFGAGRIEPDPAFPVPPGVARLARWEAGTAALVRGAAAGGGSVVAALVEGVHSARAKDAWLSRVAERRGVTTLAPLLQVALRRYRDVAATVHFAEAVPAVTLAGSTDDAALAAALRDRALALWPAAREDERSTERGDRFVPPR